MKQRIIKGIPVYELDAVHEPNRCLECMFFVKVGSGSWNWWERPNGCSLTARAKYCKPGKVYIPATPEDWANRVAVMLVFSPPPPNPLDLMDAELDALLASQ